MVNNKNIMKKCSCGTEELMNFMQKKCHSCVVKAKKEKYIKHHCLMCGRFSYYLKDGLCRYCYINPKMKVKVTSKASRCKNCGHIAPKAEKFENYCKSCYQNRDVIESNQRLLEKWESF
jgi:NMD protein affecting ribosome stability and mRNA decay